MMTKEESKRFTFLVNDPKSYDALSDYADYRIAKLLGSLMNIQTFEELKAVQATIQELRRLKGLREEVNNPTGD